MHLYINPKRGFKKILNFEQAHHFCSKQAVQKQWSLDEHSSWHKQYFSGPLSQIPNEPLLIQKQTVPHMKAPIFSLYEHEGHGIIMGVPHPLPAKRILSKEKYLRCLSAVWET
jgi:hypothetical protein